MDDPFDLPPDALGRVPLFAELAKVLSWQGGPVNWDLARQVAVSVAAGDEPTAAVDPAEAEAFREHGRLAEMWLAETTGLEQQGSGVPLRAVGSLDWAEAAATSFPELIDPVAAKASRAIGDGLPGLGDAPDEVRQALAQMTPMLMGIQAGTILGQLAREVLGSHEVPLLLDEEAVLLVAPSIDRVAVAHGVDTRSVRQWVTLQAVAKRMILDGFPWVRARFFALYHDFVSTLDVTLHEGISKLQQLDLSDPAKLQEAISEEGLFASEPSPQTAAAGARVARLLATVEAHATVAVETAGSHLGGEALRLAELFAGRAAERSGGAQALASFVGLEETSTGTAAAAFVRQVLAQGDWPLVHRIWDDGEAFPSDQEIADPARWIERVSRP